MKKTKALTRKKTLKETSIDTLLANLLDPEPLSSRKTGESKSLRDAYIELSRRGDMNKFKVYTELIDSRRTSPPAIKGLDTDQSDAPVVSEKLSIVRRCDNCYYCSASKRLGGNVWCLCSSMFRDKIVGDSKWTPSRMNLDCWSERTS